MDIARSILAALLTSTVVSTVLTFVFKTYFENRIRHHFELEMEKLRHQYEVELEKFKTELTIRADTVHEITGRRLEAYPKVVELVYRTRNMSREIATGANTSGTLVDELGARVRELEDSLYAFRIDLERDGVFSSVHTYKNTVKTLNMLLSDLSFFQNRGQDQEAREVAGKIRSLYDEIEVQHRSIIEGLSTLAGSNSTIT